MQKARDFGTLGPKWHIFIKTSPLQSSVLGIGGEAEVSNLLKQHNL